MLCTGASREAKSPLPRMACINTSYGEIHVKVCLFGSAELSLRDAMRAGASDGDLLALVRTALSGKHAAHAGACRLFGLSPPLSISA